MRHGTYIGPIARLAGLTALVQIEAGRETVKAQFDRRKNWRGERIDEAYGWHCFPLSDFELEPPVDFDLEAE